MLFRSAGDSLFVVGVNEAWIDGASGQINALGMFGNCDPGADGGELTVSDQHHRVLDRFFGSHPDCGAGQGPGGGRFRLQSLAGLRRFIGGPQERRNA